MVCAETNFFIRWSQQRNTYAPLVSSKNRWNFGLDARVFLISPSGELESSQKRVTNTIRMHAFVSTIRTDFTRDLHLLSRSFATAGNFGQIAHDCFSLRGGEEKTFFYFSPPFFLAFLLFLPPRSDFPLQSDGHRRRDKQRGTNTLSILHQFAFTPRIAWGYWLRSGGERNFLGEAKVFAFSHSRPRTRSFFRLSPAFLPGRKREDIWPGRQSSQVRPSSFIVLHLFRHAAAAASPSRTN